MNAKQKQRIAAHFPDGKPKYIRVYDNGGETLDRYTVVFTGNYRHWTNGGYLYLGMSDRPYSPMGFGQHGDHNEPIDRPSYSHLGKKIRFEDLPADCQQCTVDTYCDLWNLPEVFRLWCDATEMYNGYKFNIAIETLKPFFPGLPVTEIVMAVYNGLHAEDEVN